MLQKHPVPKEYHKLFAIGEKDRRGNIIDFKIPPVIVDSLLPMGEHKELIFAGHVPASCLPMVYTDAMNFIVLRPTGLHHRDFVRDELLISGMCIIEEFEIKNFMQFADTLYFLDPKVSFHWKWRVIVRTLHDTGVQDQNNAVIFVLKNADAIMNVKKRIRAEIGETPVLVRYAGKPEIALGIHHLHCPDSERLAIEYNVLMHARNKTSIFESPV
jgi:hypothetical protein